MRDYPKLVCPLPGPKARAVIERDARTMSQNYRKDYPLVVDHADGAGGRGRGRQPLPRLRGRHRRGLHRPLPSRRRGRRPAPGRAAAAPVRDRLLQRGRGRRSRKAWPGARRGPVPGASSSRTPGPRSWKPRSSWPGCAPDVRRSSRSTAPSTAAPTAPSASPPASPSSAAATRRCCPRCCTRTTPTATGARSTGTPTPARWSASTSSRRRCSRPRPIRARSRP